MSISPLSAKLIGMSRQLQFSLKFLFFVTTVLAVWVGSAVNRAERQRNVIASVEKLGGQLGYDYQYDTAGNEIPGARMPGPSWLHALIGDEYFRSVCYVAIGEGVADEQLALLDDGDTLGALLITSDSVTDASVTRLARLKRLKWLGLISTQVTVEGLEGLSALPELELLVCDTDVPADRAARLQEALPRCEIDLAPGSLWRFLLQGTRVLPPLRPR
jgi:hypothetical protein